MNKVFTAALLTASLAAGTALAQSASTTTNGPAMGTTNNATDNAAVGSTSASPPAIATPGVDSQTKAAPVPGANSFTEAQALDRLEAHGYADVTDLQLDDQQIWRGKATKNGNQVNVALDYQGNIVSQ